MTPLLRQPLVGIACRREPGSFGVWSGEMDFIEWAYLEALADAGAVPVAIPAPPRGEPGPLELDALLGAGAPVIGISTYREELGLGARTTTAAVLPHSYVAAVERAGAQAVLLAPIPGAAELTLDLLDGLVLSGGGDIEPARYGGGEVGSGEAALLDVRSERDGAELALIEGALQRDLPLLGICRGHQLLNVAFGGDLLSHLPDAVGHDGHKETPGVFARHAVAMEPGTRLGALLGERVVTPSHHHQAIGRLAPELALAGRAEDGTVEAVELPGARFAAGIQWHPEEDEDARLFEALVAEAEAYGEERSR
jgi:gamma-glutamyl-gamma-aminobutyrate hydrolase PuuD